jgi:importin subunit beta-1
MTIGYICEELDSDDMEKDDADLIISALLESIKDANQNEEMLKISMEAVLHSLTFAEKIFEENKGGIIVNRVLECANAVKSSTVGAPTMMCLAEIVRLYYAYIHEQMESITEVTFGVMKGDFEDEVKTLAIEVWCSLCEEEIYLKKRNPNDCKNYTETVFDQLLELMLMLLNSCDIDEDDDTDTWNTSTAAGCCLNLMAQNVGDQIIESVIQFVENKIGGDAGWKDKYFGLIALGAILEGPSKDKLINVLAPAMSVILTLYSDRSRKIRETTAWFFSRVAQNH